MVRTLLHEWADGRPYTDTTDQIRVLPQPLDFCNWVRPYLSVSGKPLMSRMALNDSARKTVRYCSIRDHVSSRHAHSTR